jgi:hypothetical protein
VFDKLFQKALGVLFAALWLAGTGINKILNFFRR